ncbi:hypothetical protein GDO86_003600 [Hymenochirus boettgeri]|uniref:Uncharacterized protein n=1 Tax=Hymenochirus boettgeri TaxID=247094 RepID=A0A8T2KAB7_9PIPI|nr:hypothetical protein GDO86_003600 [Hymenochirus boettgeri]
MLILFCLGERDSLIDLAPKVTNPPPKKSAPPPPVPNKVKPNANPSNKPNTESLQDTNQSAKQPNTSTIDGLRISSVKLAHPTTDRPKVQGRRPPKGRAASPEDPKTSSPLSPPSPTTKCSLLSPIATQTGHREETPNNPSVQSLQVEDLAAEISSLKFMMEILKNKHEKDMETIRFEINKERDKRLALQVNN